VTRVCTTADLLTMIVMASVTSESTSTTRFLLVAQRFLLVDAFLVLEQILVLEQTLILASTKRLSQLRTS
jgi:hypothetical protein